MNHLLLIIHVIHVIHAVVMLLQLFLFSFFKPTPFWGLIFTDQLDFSSRAQPPARTLEVFL